VTSSTRIFGTDGEVSGNRAANFDEAYSNTRAFGNPSQIIDLPNWDAVVSAFSVLAHPSHCESKAGFRGLFNGNAGWVNSTNAMAIVKRECESLGVKFAAGVNGTVIELLREGCDGGTVTGVKTEDGKEWAAEKVILAAGSYGGTLLDFEGQIIATGYCVSHVKMTKEQYQRYKHIPVINISRRGYSFPPNDDRIFKICNLDTSFTYHDHPLSTKHAWGPVSIPRDFAYNPTDSQPDEGLEVTRRFMQYILPEFGDAEIESSNMCWDMESHDQNWLITPHPSSPTSLLIATGGSGTSFKNLVNVGKYIVQALEGKLDERYREIWKWRPEKVGDPESEERGLRYKIALEEATGWKH